MRMRMLIAVSTCMGKMAFLNRLVGIGAGLAITGAAVNATLYNGKS